MVSMELPAGKQHFLLAVGRLLAVLLALAMNGHHGRGAKG
jgi:hypothetical protein